MPTSYLVRIPNDSQRPGRGHQEKGKNVVVKNGEQEMPLPR